MANRDTTDPIQPKHMTFSNSRVPFIGCLIDYFEIGFNYLCRRRSFTDGEKLRISDERASLTATFLALVCLLLGFIANVKLEVVMLDESALSYDLHVMLMSKEENVYIDDIDPSRVMWYIEASDCAALLISCLLIWSSSYAKSPLSEYLFLPWMGVTLRGLLLRQLPTVAALGYTMAVIDIQHINWVFLTGLSFLLAKVSRETGWMGVKCGINILDAMSNTNAVTQTQRHQNVKTEFELYARASLETRISLEVARVVRSRWEQRDSSNERRMQVQTLWSSEEDDGDVPSVEMRNFVY